MSRTTVPPDVPPGVDVFDYHAAVLAAAVYPDFGRPFWIQAYVVVGLCSTLVVAIASGLIARWKKGRLRLMLIDGPATRVNPKVAVPLLWLLMGILIVILTFWLRDAVQHHRLTFALGVFWWLFGATLVCSYVTMCISALCRAPLFRSLLVRLNSGRESTHSRMLSVLVLNLVGIAVCLATFLILLVPARMSGRYFEEIDRIYKGAQDIIAEARAANDTSLLAGLKVSYEDFERAQIHSRRAHIVGGWIYTAYIAIAFVVGLVPTVQLNRYMNKQISRLRDDLNVSAHQSDSMANASETQFTSDSEVALHHCGPKAGKVLGRVDLPKDRPFANLAEAAVLPSGYAHILGSTSDPVAKTQRLRAALRRDNFQLLAFFMLLACMGSLLLFQAVGGVSHMTAKKKLSLLYIWLTWSYLAPALILAGAFLWDAVSGGSDIEQAGVLQEMHKPRQKFNAPPLAAIQLSQTVEVLEEHPASKKDQLARYA